MTTAHSKLGASSMHRWAECPGSVRLCVGAPNGSTFFAAEGTAAHELAARCLTNGNDADVYGGEWEHDGHKGEISEDMTEAVQVYLDAVRADAVEDDGSAPIRMIEQKFHLKELHADLFGTADCVQVWPGKKLMRVYDYKHGKGVPVDVASNPQLLYYALGALLSYKKPIAEVEIVIVQPRCAHPDGPVRRHRFKAVELLDFENDLMAAVKRTEDPNAELKTGDHCRWCPATVSCPQIKRTVQDAARAEFGPAKKYDPAELAKTLELLPLIEGWVKNVREFAYGEALHGRTPPGYKLVDKRPTRKWSVDDHTLEIELGKIGLAESDIYEDPVIKSPAQIEKAIGKPKANADKFAAVAKLCASVSSGVKLVPESEPGEPVKRSAQEDFKNA